MLDQKKLKELIHYSPETGEFTWASTRPGVKVGSSAGSVAGFGYIQVRINRRKYMAHRLAWLYMTGSWPLGDVDHVNRNRSDNRWSNLREASRCENQWNSGLAKTNKSGVKGVHIHKPSGKWRAMARVSGKICHIGMFSTIEEAAGAVSEFRKLHHGEYARDACREAA